jgi:alpha-ketoglutarate-dependent 2,4-dichlorophenoxyacetate dioxygenase
MEVTRLAPAMGAEIAGLDLSQPLDEPRAQSIAAALQARGVLVFRDQPIDDQAHARFGRRFGELARFRESDNWDGAVPEIFRGANVDAAGSFYPPDDERARMLKLNWLWHIDSSYRPIPTRGAILRGIEVVEDAADTIFANLCAAYEALPAAMKDRIDGLYARHSFLHLVKTRGMPPLNDEQAAALPPVDHPLVRRHADGRRSLYLSPPYIETIAGWDRAESMALVEELTAWASQERFTHRHRWRAHDVIMWDNGWTMHRVTPFDIGRVRRVMHGVVLLGTERIEPLAPPGA